MKPNMTLLTKAYEIGRSRRSALSLDYFASPDGKQIFCRNQQSPEGMLVSEEHSEFIGGIPSGFVHFDMYDARN
jgi:hypothetical protein